jgi:aldehyde dehydrogenase (NAD+)
MGVSYLESFALEYALWLWIPLLLAGVQDHRRRGSAAVPLLFSVVVASHALYVAAIGGDHFEYRPLDLYFPFLHCLVFAGAAHLARAGWSRAGVLAGVALMVAVVVELPLRAHLEFPAVYTPGFPGRVTESDEEAAAFLDPDRGLLSRLPGLRALARRHRDLVLRMTDHFVAVRQEEHELFLETAVQEARDMNGLIGRGILPPDTHIAVDCVGAIPYLTGLRVVDRLGLTDADVAHSEFTSELMAHGKYATWDYARARGVDLWAADNVHLLWRRDDPRLLRTLLDLYRRQRKHHFAEVGEGQVLVAWLAQGLEDARRRFPALRFRSVHDPRPSARSRGEHRSVADCPVRDSSVGSADSRAARFRYNASWRSSRHLPCNSGRCGKPRSADDEATGLRRSSTMRELLQSLGIQSQNPGACAGRWIDTRGPELVSVNPSTGEPIASVRQAAPEDYEQVVRAAELAFATWRMVPAPGRGEIVRQLADELRRHKPELGRLVSLENGKILSEGLGEVQEMIDICDFAVGLSRQLYGWTMHSERPRHRMYEQWHPLGPIGIITAFNFPVAVWAWNAAIAAVCGDTMIWKPSSKVPLAAVAVQQMANRVMERNGLTGVFNLVVGGGGEVGERLVADRRVPLISATGSCRMGRHIGEVVSRRLGRSLLELGGNNAVIVMDDANLDLALRAVVFGAVGTAGQRCTSTRRLFLHRPIARGFTDRLIAAYRQVRIGDPLDERTLMGPLIDEAAAEQMMAALAQVRAQGGEILCGGRRLDRPGFFVEPTVVRARPDMPIVQEETFAPILYVFEVATLEEALTHHNRVPQGLSSSIFTTNLLAAETFLSHRGSDCGIANVNIGTSGAEIGGAFGGEKDTGGGREAGSDAWKAYMRRQTSTINWGEDLPLAQGVRFDL